MTEGVVRAGSVGGVIGEVVGDGSVSEVMGVLVGKASLGMVTGDAVEGGRMLADGSTLGLTEEMYPPVITELLSGEVAVSSADKVEVGKAVGVVVRVVVGAVVEAVKN